MRDGYNLARLGIPAVALVTEEFQPQGDFVAQSLGMPDLPRIRLPHPVAGTGTERMAEIAAEVAPKIIAALESSEAGSPTDP